MSKKRTRGYVYLIANPWMPSIVKAGRTRDLSKRLDQLYTRGVPPGTGLARAWEADDAAAAEAEAAALLEPYRITPRREHFRIAAFDAADRLEELFGSDGRLSVGERDVAAVGVPAAFGRAGQGEVAVLSNRWMLPSMVVVGTSAAQVAARLSATGVPESFVVEAAWRVPDQLVVEQAVDAKLGHLRIGSDREFFHLSSHQAVQAVESVLCSLGLLATPIRTPVVSRSKRKRQSWSERLQDLAAFIDRHGRLPGVGQSAAASAEERSLRQFIDVSRKKFRYGKMPAAQVKAMSAVFPLKTLPNGWDRHLQRLEIFVRGKGRLPRRGSADRNEHYLGAWHLNQREARLSPSQRRRFEAVVRLAA